MFIFTFVIFFIYSFCKTDRSFKNFDSYIKQNLTSNASLIMNNQPCFGLCVLNIWDSNFSFIDRSADEIAYKLLKPSVSTHYCTTLLNDYKQQERRHYLLLNSNSRDSSNVINNFNAFKNCQQYPVIWLCGETKSMISNILILNSENNTENDHLADARFYTHYKNIFLADQKKYNFLFNKTQDGIRIDESNHQAQSVTFKGRRLLSHLYYDAEDEESKSATQSHTKTGNHDEKSKNNELETEDDYGDDLYDDDDNAEEEEENQEDVLYEEEPVTDRPDEDEDDDEDDPEEDIDLSSAETSAPLLTLVCSLALLTLLDFIY
ncbi:nucleomorphin-like isoform X2 [Nasonia vitripennis]|uniref:Uncharacterized protein n=1 Tax=Nasonia vitripennis TaxID=7425 RepID=A0A7M7HCS4_NASVI|nr:nucleomorphin-like isoform X2 [Nasonia vitripennis]